MGDLYWLYYIYQTPQMPQLSDEIPAESLKKCIIIRKHYLHTQNLGLNAKTF